MPIINVKNKGTKGTKTAKKESVDEVAFEELYNRGFTDREIADVMGVKQDTVKKFRQRRGLSPNTSKLIENSRFEELYSRGLTDREIADAMGVKRSTVKKFRQRRGLPPNSGSKKKSKIKIKTLLELVSENKNDLEIAKTLKVTRQTIINNRKKYNIESVFGPGRPKRFTGNETDPDVIAMKEAQIINAKMMSKRGIVSNADLLKWAGSGYELRECKYVFKTEEFAKPSDVPQTINAKLYSGISCGHIKGRKGGKRPVDNLENYTAFTRV